MRWFIRTGAVAEKVAVRYSANNVFDLRELADLAFPSMKSSPFPQWVGKLYSDSDIRRLYGISVIAVKTRTDYMRFMPRCRPIPIAGDNHLMHLENRVMRGEDCWESI